MRHPSILSFWVTRSISARVFIGSLFVAVFLIMSEAAVGQDSRQPNVTQIAHGLKIPWDMVWGPNESIWFTERGGKIRRFSLADSSVHTLYEFRDSLFLQHESGLLGMTLHPAFPDSPFVYVAVSMRDVDDVPCLRILRFMYDQTSGILNNAHTIFNHKPVTEFHLGCRLAFLSDGTLLASIGDAPQIGLVQDDNTSYGKVIRLHSDGRIPEDNPISGLPMYTKGHRNVQGLVVLPNGTVITSEHGNVIEDEINILRKGENYGWPLIEGPCDIPEELDTCTRYGMVDPMWSTGDHTIALSGLAYYASDRYPELHNSLLSTTLKGVHLLQLSLNTSQDSVIFITKHASGVFGRLRDVLVSPDGRVFFCTSNYDQSGYFPFPKEFDDRIMELKFVEATGVPSVQISPDTIHFAARPGDVDTTFVVVKNTSEVAFMILAAYPTKANAAHTPMEYRWPYTIYPGRSEVVPLRYSPTKEGEDTTTIQFHINEGLIAAQNILCTGTTMIGRITPIIDTVHVIDDTSTIVLFVNDGTDTIGVLDVILNDSSKAEVLDIDNMRLAPGDTVRVTVRYRESGKDSSVIVVTIRTSTNKLTSTIVERVVTTSVLEFTPRSLPFVLPIPIDGETFSVYGLSWEGQTTYQVLDVTGRTLFTSASESMNGRLTGAVPYDVAVRGLCYLRLVGSHGRSVIIPIPVAR